MKSKLLNLARKNIKSNTIYVKKQNLLYFQTSDTEAVLDGRLDGFITAYLRPGMTG